MIMAIQSLHWVVFLSLLLFSQHAELAEENVKHSEKSGDLNNRKTIFHRYWNWRLLNAPEFATSIGEHKYDDRLDEMSLSSYHRRKDDVRLMLEELKELRNRSDFKNSFDFDVLQDELEEFLHGQKFKTYAWPFNNLEGPQLDFPRLISYMNRKTKDDYSMIIGRFRLFSQQIDETIILMREGIRLGLTMHKLSITLAKKVFKDISEQPVESSAVFKPFKNIPAEISIADQKRLVSEAKYTIEHYVQSSYRRLYNFIQSEYWNNTRPQIAASSLPNGREYYAACLKFHTTTDLTPEEIQNIGFSEVKRIRKRMVEVKKRVHYEGSLNEFLAYLRAAPQFRFKDGADIIAYYKDIGKRIMKKIPYYFSVIPKIPYIITPIAPDVAPSFPGAFYLHPQNKTGPGTFFINTYKPETRRKYEAMALSLHEAVPGHHLQAVLTMQKGPNVNFRKYQEDRKYWEAPGRFPIGSAYIEGWGLYSEFLGEEMGMFSDPYDLVGRLSLEMMRAVRLVVDTGIHAFGWSRERAVKYFQQNTAVADHDIEAEVDRYITWPGQACGYKIGEIKIRKWREMAESKLGSRFNLRKFNTLIASMGSVPLKLLKVQIDAFIRDSEA